jgi:RNA 3'-terminal phosphate cyclase
MVQSSLLLRYKGCSLFRQRITASTLSCRPLRIDDIRLNDFDNHIKSL